MVEDSLGSHVVMIMMIWDSSYVWSADFLKQCRKSVEICVNVLLFMFDLGSLTPLLYRQWKWWSMPIKETTISSTIIPQPRRFAVAMSYRLSFPLETLWASTGIPTIREHRHSDINLDPEFLIWYDLINRAAKMTRQPDKWWEIDLARYIAAQ